MCFPLFISPYQPRLVRGFFYASLTQSHFPTHRQPRNPNRKYGDSEVNDEKKIISTQDEDQAEDPTVELILEKSGLSEKRQSFVREYMIDNNATQAAKRAKYSEHTAYSQGHRLLKNADIAKTISKIKTARVTALGFGKEDLINFRIETIRSPHTTHAQKERAAAYLDRIWGLYENKINVNLTGNLAEQMENARRRAASARD